MCKLTKGGCLLKSQKALLLSPRNEDTTEHKCQDRMTTHPCTLLSMGRLLISLDVLHKPFSCSFTNRSSRDFVACQGTWCLRVVVHTEGP